MSSFNSEIVFDTVKGIYFIKQGATATPLSSVKILEKFPIRQPQENEENWNLPILADKEDIMVHDFEPSYYQKRS